MSILKKFSAKSAAILASLALLMGIASVNAACFCWFHQPVVPEGMKKFKK